MRDGQVLKVHLDDDDDDDDDDGDDDDDDDDDDDHDDDDEGFCSVAKDLWQNDMGLLYKSQAGETCDRQKTKTLSS